MRMGERAADLDRAAYSRREQEHTRHHAIPRDIQEKVTADLFERMDVEKAADMPRKDLLLQLERAIEEIADRERYSLSAREQSVLAQAIADEMQGIGPLEPLLREEDITDIMVNGPDRVFVERNGRLHRTAIRFHDEEHLRQIAVRMARKVNRRLDENSPMVDARLSDGSRVNIVIAPISMIGTVISIRRFPDAAITLDRLVSLGSIDRNMKVFLEVAARSRLNIIISGGTSSGKTTLLNALSQHVQEDERVITIEDSAELRLLQPHVIPLETRPATLESQIEVTQRHLVKNALRMRPDRIILGEVRGGEAFDMLQAMNTGHDGSMGTLHANSPRDATGRLENMILMARLDLPTRAIRGQIASAVDLIIQAERCPDGVRRIVAISEVTGIESDTITMQDLFVWRFGEAKSGKPSGRFETIPNMPRSIEKMARHNLAKAVRPIFQPTGGSRAG